MCPDGINGKSIHLRVWRTESLKIKFIPSLFLRANRFKCGASFILRIYFSGCFPWPSKPGPPCLIPSAPLLSSLPVKGKCVPATPRCSQLLVLTWVCGWGGRSIILLTEETLGQGCAYRRCSIDTCWVTVRTFGHGDADPIFSSSAQADVLSGSRGPWPAHSGSPSAHSPKTLALCPPIFLICLPVQLCAVGARVRGLQRRTPHPGLLWGCHRGRPSSDPRTLQKNKWCAKGLEPNSASHLQPPVHSCAQCWPQRSLHIIALTVNSNLKVKGEFPHPLGVCQTNMSVPP